MIKLKERKYLRRRKKENVIYQLFLQKKYGLKLIYIDTYIY